MISEAQKLARMDGIGGSDWYLLLKDPAQLFAIKTGQAPGPEETDQMAAGTLFEEPIAQLVLRKRPTWFIEPAIDTVYHRTYPWALSHPDRYVTRTHETGGTMGVLEIKNSRYYKAPTDYHLCQLEWAMLTTGYEWGALAVLVSGCDLRIFEVEADYERQENMLAIAADFWREVERYKETHA